MESNNEVTISTQEYYSLLESYFVVNTMKKIIGNTADRYMDSSTYYVIKMLLGIEDKKGEDDK